MTKIEFLTILREDQIQFGTMEIGRGPKWEAADFDLQSPTRALRRAPRDQPGNDLALSTSLLGMTCLATSACILWSEFLNRAFRVEQPSPRYGLSLWNQAVRETHRIFIQRGIKSAYKFGGTGPLYARLALIKLG